MEVHDLLHGRTGRKKIGGRKEICLTFLHFAPVVKKIFQTNFPNLLSGGGERIDYKKFLLDSIFPTNMIEFPTKLTEFVPFIFIIMAPILPDCEANIARLALFAQQTGGGGLPPSLPGTPMICYHVNQAKKLPAIIVLIYKSIN